MARNASENPNSPSEEHVRDAVAAIEASYAELASERGVYMQKCRRIREVMANEYENAADRGVSKKLLKKIIKERDLERKIDALTDDLEPDEISQHQMLIEKLGEFANTPLGSAALQRAEMRSKMQAAGA